MSAMLDSVALEDGQRSIAYRDLPGLLAAETTWLADLAPAGARYAVLADNGVGWAVTDLALHAARWLNVPLPGYFTDAQVAHAINDASVEVVLTDDPARVALLDHGFEIVAQSDRTGLTAVRRRIEPDRRRVVPTGTTKITYTSGSTGTPKGVCLAAATLETVARSLNQATRACGTQRHLCLLPLATLLDNLAGLIAAPLAGATCILPSLRSTGIRYGGLDSRALLACVSSTQPQSLILVPELLRLLGAAVEHGWQAPRSLKFVAVGGASVAPELLAHALDVGLPVVEGYGLSECASVVALNAPDTNRLGSVGRPLPHARVRIDASGEVRVSGATMLGYLGEPPIDHAGPDGPEIATGDLGELDDDGYLYIRGRLKNLLITSFGRNLAPEWIERELLVDGTLAQAIVFGDARPHPVAIVVPTPGHDDPRHIDAAVAAANLRLPDYARVRAWRNASSAFSLADGTLTANGRLRRDAIRAREARTLANLYQTAEAS